MRGCRCRWIALAALLAGTVARGAQPTKGVAGDADFAAGLFTAVAGSTKGNVFVSPFSIRAALAMTATGARGETARQMSATLHLPADGSASASFGRLTEAMVHAPGSGPVFTVQNGLWAQAGVPFERSFLARCTLGFGATAELANFAADPEAERLKINAWAAKQTHDRVTDLLPPGTVRADTRMVLADAVYFKGDWAHPFTAEATHDQAFHLDGSHDATVKMMAREVEGGMAYDGPTVWAIDLAYAGANTSLLVIVPKAIEGLPAIERLLTGDQLRAWVSHLHPTDVSLSLPRFRAAGHYALKEPLIGMGMALPFDNRNADFSGMVARSAGQGVCLGEVMHGSFVAVDEKGTEAAAATAVMGVTASAAPVQRKWLDIVADRPFLYVLRHRPTGTILFMGRCADPRS